MRLYIIYYMAGIMLAECSKELRTMEPFVVGGDYVKIKYYPHAAFLEATCADSRWMCGSSILNQILILTAAHCLYGCNLNSKTDQIDVFVGHEDVKKVKIVRSGKKMVLHEHYNDLSTENDIALLLVHKDLPFGSTVKRIILTRRPAYNGGSVAGWGLENDKTGYSSKRLKAVAQAIQPKSICRKAGRMDPGMFCAGSLQKKASRPSSGDSGSGFVNKKSQLLGLVSWRNDEYPGLVVYSNISYYYHWIIKTAHHLYCPKARG